MNTVTRSARRATRDVKGGTKDLTTLARIAHRANRAACRRACRRAILDGDTDYRDSHRVCGRDIS